MNIYDMTKPALMEYLKEHGRGAGNAKAIFKGLYRDKVKSFREIKDISEPVIKLLEDNFTLNLPEVVETTGDDTVTKALLKLSDGRLIESVLMHQEYGDSICVSTEIGCNMACAFCESGKYKKERGLTPGEMAGQLVTMENLCGVKIKTVAVMGIGEPFDNFKNVMDFIEIITEPYGLEIGPRHITVSTCGLVPKIKEFADLKNGCGLAISLHAPNDILRKDIMPVAKAFDIESLRDSMNYYNEKTGKKVFLEYIMLKGINDGIDEAKELGELLKDVNCTVNLIPYNETNTMGFKRTSAEDTLKFYHTVRDAGVHATIRREFGGEVKAACGQLKSEHILEESKK